MRCVREITFSENILTKQEFTRHLIAFEQLGFIRLIIFVRQRKNILLFTSRHCFCVVCGKKCYRCQKSGFIYAVHYIGIELFIFAADNISAFIPIIPQIKFICGKGRGYKFKNSQRNTAGIYIFKHFANSFSRCFFAECNYRQLIPGNCIQHLCSELFVFFLEFFIVTVILFVSVCPIFACSAIEHDVQRKHFFFIFRFVC